ncbi:MAG: efflux transporter outer membrane subunit [Beijerinckiaceae bacterium]
MSEAPVAGEPKTLIVATPSSQKGEARWRMARPGFACRQLVMVLLPLGLSGCMGMVGPDFETPKAPEVSSFTPEPLASPAGQQFQSGRDIPTQWWGAFHSRALSDLVVRSLRQNPSIEAAEAAIRVAAATRDAQIGALFPQVAGTFNPTANRTSGSLSPVPASGSLYYRLYTAQVSVSYVVDIWGGTRRAVENLQAQTEMQRWQWEAAKLTLTSNVVTAAIQEASLRGQIEATRNLIKIAADILSNFKKQKEFGQVSDLDVLTQQAALETFEQTLPPLQKQLAQQRDLLTALAGQYSNDEIRETFNLGSFRLPRQLPVTLPSALVRQRPDVLSAEANMHAMDALIGVAIANRLPNITLSGLAGPQSTTFATLFTPSSMAWTFGGNVAQSIFDGGTLYFRQKAAEQGYRQADAEYRSTVITAFQNVTDALRALQTDSRAVSATVRAENTAKRYLELVRQQAKLGQVAPLVILNAQQTYLQAVINRIQAQASRMADTTALFMALGGGWWNEPSPEPVIQEAVAKKGLSLPELAGLGDLLPK